MTALPSNRGWVLDSLRTALQTRGVQLLVSGEPGIGKSFLVGTVYRECASAAPLVYSEAGQFGLRPLQTLKELLADVPYEVLRGMPRVLLEAYEFALASSEYDSGSAEYAGVLPSAVGYALIGLAGLGRTVVIENWQWVDAESRRLLQHAFRQPAVRAAVSAIVTERASTQDETRTEDTAFPASDTVVVPPIPSRDLHDVIRGHFHDRLPAIDESRAIELSHGNPLWALELARLRVENPSSDTIPASIVAALHDRLGRMSSAGLRTLQVVSALGGVRRSDSVRYLPDGAEGLPAAVSAGAVTMDEGWIHASHPLLARASLSLMDASSRALLYTELSRLPVPFAQRVELLDSAATTGTDEQLASELSVAALAKRQTGAVKPAVRLARRALRRTAVDSVHLGERQLLAAGYALAAGDLDAALGDLAEVNLPELPEDVFDRVADLLAEACYRTGGEALVRRRFRSVLQRPDLPRSFHNIIDVHLIGVARIRTADDLDRLLSIDAELCPETTPYAKAAAKQAIMAIRIDTGGGLDDHALQYLRRTESSSAPATVERSADALEGFLAYQVDDLARSRAALHAAVVAARASGEDYAVVQSVAHSSIVETLSGQLPVARALLGGVADREADLRRNLPASIYRAEALLALAHDDGDRVQEMAAESYSPGGEDRGELLRKSTLGLLAAQRGESETAAEFLTSAVDAAERRGIVEPGRRMWIDVELVRALIHLGAHELVPDAIARIEPAARDPRRRYAAGQLDRLNALHHLSVGDGERAVELIERGVSRILSSGFRLEAVRTQLDQAEILRGVGKDSRAHQALREAQGMNDRIGSESLAREISRVQAVVVIAQQTSPLTVSERRVVDLVTRGHSNRSAAAALHLSQRTIETHLSSVYRKTGIRSRTELVIRLGD